MDQGSSKDKVCILTFRGAQWPSGGREFAHSRESSELEPYLGQFEFWSNFKMTLNVRKTVSVVSDLV